MSNLDVVELTIAETAALIRAKKISPVELTRAFLDRVQQVDSLVQAWVTVVGDKAIRRAREVEARILKNEDLGPLQGIPYGAKDIICTAGIRTSAGSLVDPDFVPAENAAVIDRLDAGGAILLGKTTTTEFAFLGGEPKTRNPWNLDHTPGGSSSGSGAALASATCLFTLGTQTIGSLLRPAAYNGLTCLKSTYGRVSRRGVIPASESLDHVGAFTRTAEDSAIVLEVIAGYDPLDAAGLTDPAPSWRCLLNCESKDIVVGIPTDCFKSEEASVAAAVENALQVFREFGVAFCAVDMPRSMEAAAGALINVMRTEAAAYHEERFRQVPEKFGPYIREQLLLGRQTSAVDYLRSQKVRQEFRRELLQVFQSVDVIATPSTPTVAPAGYRTGNPVFNGPFTNAGVPAISIPVGFDNKTGLPIGLQLAGRPMAEGLLLSMAHRYQQVTDWHKKRPALSGR